MDTFAPELLIRILCQLDATDLAEVSCTCRQLNKVLFDDQLWRGSFIQRWSREPSNPIKSWRQEYIRRYRRQRIWQAKALHQLMCYRFKEESGILDVRPSFDQRNLFVASRECLTQAHLELGGKLQRSVHYFSKTYDDDAFVTAVSFPKVGGQVALGLCNSKLVVCQSIPSVGKDKDFYSIPFPPSQTPHSNDSLPIQRLQWNQTSTEIIGLCRRDTFPLSRLVRWDLSSQKIKQVVEKFDINCWLVIDKEDMLIFGFGNYISNGQWEIKVSTGTIHQLFELSGLIGSISFDSQGQITFIDPKLGKIVKCIQVSNSAISCIFSSRSASSILIADEDGFVFKLLFYANNFEIIKLNDEAIPRRILDLFENEVCIFILCLDTLMVLDNLSFEIIGNYPIPSKMRKVSGRDLDSLGHLNASFKYFNDDQGRFLVKWGNRNVHYWNFGPRLAQLDQRRPSTDKTSTKSSKVDRQKDLEEDLQAYQDEQEEIEEWKRMKSLYSLNGVSEAEQIQLAQLLSMQSPKENGGAFRTEPQPHQNEDDYELQLALRLSLSEIEK